MAEQIGDDRSDSLPEGTDTVIEGAASSGGASSTANTGDAGTATLEQTAAPRSTTGGPQSSGGGIADRLCSGREQFAS